MELNLDRTNCMCSNLLAHSSHFVSVKQFSERLCYSFDVSNSMLHTYCLAVCYQVAEREALFDFHEKHQACRLFARDPHMNGRRPLLWSKLTGQFMRLNHIGSPATVSVTREPSTTTAQPAATSAAALTNNVTKICYLPAAGQREVAVNNMRTCVAAMPMSLDPAAGVPAGKLYFVDFPRIRG
eukprot:5643070-Pleurochrysis_carterae.AAC.3